MAENRGAMLSVILFNRRKNMSMKLLTDQQSEVSEGLENNTNTARVCFKPALVSHGAGLTHSHTLYTALKGVLHFSTIKGTNESD